MTLTARALTAGDADLLRTMTAAEAVVPIRSPADLARRLAPDRRIFAVHAGDGVQGFVHVALARRLPRTLDEILSGPRLVGPPSVAIFYGVTRIGEAVRGQAGQLLDAVSGALLAERPALRLVTLSPVPGFRAWLEEQLGDHVAEASQAIEHLARHVAAGLADPRAEALAALARLYLSAEDARGRIRDPVARFHLGNGASVERILVGGDCSWRGLRDAFGLMVSYRYHPKARWPVARPTGDVAALIARLAPARCAA